MGIAPQTTEDPTAPTPKVKGESETPSSHFMYVLNCADGTLYTGYTTDVEQRMQVHNSGKGAKYTRSRTPVSLAAQVGFATKHEAMSAEYHFKRLTRKQKDALIKCMQSAGAEEIEALRSALLP